MGDGWHADDGNSAAHGMYTFGLKECNLYQQPEEIGRGAVERNPDDVLGIHAVVQTYEMAARIRDGVRFMRSREADWTEVNFVNVHNSWHYALNALQGGDTEGASPARPAAPKVRDMTGWMLRHPDFLDTGEQGQAQRDPGALRPP